MPLFALASPSSINLWPLAILGIGLATIVLLITRLRVHAFFALIFVAILTGMLSEKLPGEYGTLPNSPSKEKSHWIQSIELTIEGFGKIASKIGVVIALASVIGTCLVESGAADKVVRRFLALFGERRAGAALFSSSYVLSIPIFFDTFFMLLQPIARALRLRTGKNYMLFVLAICCGGTVTHSLVAPHPGPLAMAENLQLDLGQTILVGIIAGIIPALCGWMVARWASRRLDAPLRDANGAEVGHLEEITPPPEKELPSLAWSLTPVLLPILLIGGASFLSVFGANERIPAVFPILEFIG